MIVVKLMGGLGNQLFQYAAGRRLAHCSDVPLQLDLSWFDLSSPGTTPRTYALHPFKVRQDLSFPAKASPLSAPLRRLKVLARRLSPFPGSYLKEKHYHFDPEMLTPRREAYLDGYWQSERYFRDIREILLEEFALRTAPAGLNESLAGQMRNEEAPVAVHIRRGDYVDNAAVNDFHGTCSPQYYEAAAGRIASRFPDARFFVFTDDPAWVAANLAIGRPFTLVTHNGPEAAHEDLRLMTLCRHHIIANSTFSWWGAWLSRGADQMVIAPGQWFAGPEPDAKDVIPESWIKL